MISVILPTRNRAKILPFALAALDKAAAGYEVEVIVIDNGSTDETKEVVQSTSCTNIRLCYVLEPIAGVCRAKNRGINASKGDILVFTDDDCQVAPDYFRALMRHYSEGTGAFIRGGRVELGDPNDAPITIKTDKEAAILGGNQHPGGFVHGCNLTMSRRVTEIIGMWDERFGPGAVFKAAEETELNYRAHKAGIPVYYVPDLISYHFHGRKDLAAVKALNWTYQIGNGALYGKHADMLLTKHLYWNGRNWVMEWFGGRLFDPVLKLSHGELFLGQLAGAFSYWLSVLGTFIACPKYASKVSIGRMLGLYKRS